MDYIKKKYIAIAFTFIFTLLVFFKPFSPIADWYTKINPIFANNAKTGIYLINNGFNPYSYPGIFVKPIELYFLAWVDRFGAVADYIIKIINATLCGIMAHYFSILVGQTQKTRSMIFAVVLLNPITVRNWIIPSYTTSTTTA